LAEEAVDFQVVHARAEARHRFRPETAAERQAGGVEAGFAGDAARGFQVLRIRPSWKPAP
jgi:hypothetical protein